MRWDYGKVYKEIRKSKGLTQDDICHDFLSRSTLARIESGNIIPRFDNMVFLLEQINMTFEEFEYICNLYHPSERQRILNSLYIPNSLTGIKDIQKLKVDCENYLKTHHDVPIEQILDISTVFLHIRENGIDNDVVFRQTTQKIWKYLEKQDTWYGNDLRLLSTILYHFPIETLQTIFPKILESLERYANFPSLMNIQRSLLNNLSTIYLQNNLLAECEIVSVRAIDLAKKSQHYPSLAFAQVRLGICRKDDALIEKGLALLELTDENQLLTALKDEVKTYQKW